MVCRIVDLMKDSILLSYGFAALYYALLVELSEQRTLTEHAGSVSRNKKDAKRNIEELKRGERMEGEQGCLNQSL